MLLFISKRWAIASCPHNRDLGLVTDLALEAGPEWMRSCACGFLPSSSLALPPGCLHWAAFCITKTFHHWGPRKGWAFWNVNPNKPGPVSCPSDRTKIKSVLNFLFSHIYLFYGQLIHDTVHLFISLSPRNVSSFSSKCVHMNIFYLKHSFPLILKFLT